MSADAAAAIESAYRSDWGRIVAALIRVVGDFDAAEEAAQAAFAAAAQQWPIKGVPEYPRAWLVQTARHKAVDRLRRETRLEGKLAALGPTVDRVDAPEYERDDIP